MDDRAKSVCERCRTAHKLKGTRSTTGMFTKRGGNVGEQKDYLVHRQYYCEGSNRETRYAAARSELLGDSEGDLGPPGTPKHKHRGKACAWSIEQASRRAVKRQYDWGGMG